MRVISSSDKDIRLFFPMVYFCVSSVLSSPDGLLSMGMGWDPPAIVMTVGAPGL